MPDRPSLRNPDLPYRTGTFLVTFVTAHRRPLLGQIHDGAFVPSVVGRIVEESIEWTGAGPMGARVLAAQCMPDHVHIVVDLRVARAGLGRFVATVKARATREAHRHHHIPATTPLWQRSYHDRWLTSAVAACRAIRYVEANPEQAAERRKTSR